MKKYKECAKFANRAIKEFQETLNNGEDIDSPDVISTRTQKLLKVKEKLISSYDVAAVVAISQGKKSDGYSMLEEAYKVSEEAFGASDRRTIDYKRRMDEISGDDLRAPEKDNYIGSQAEKPIKITKDSILATTYETLNETRLKLIIVDYIKDKTIKIYGMRKDGTFVKSLCIPYTIFQVYFKSEGKIIKAQDVRNEGAIEWMMNHIELSEDNRLLFVRKGRI